MLDVKKFEKLLEDGQRKRADYDRKIAKLRAEYEKHGAAVNELQAEKAQLQRKLVQFDRGDLPLSERELAQVGDRLRHLTGLIAKANQPWSEADQALRKAEDEARGALAQMRSETLQQWLTETRAADAEYTAAWRVL